MIAGMFKSEVEDVVAIVVLLPTLTNPVNKKVEEVLKESKVFYSILNFHSDDKFHLA